jgi:YesN/AraC family two-component response regulator
LERESFALVIVDIVMPQLDGLSVIKIMGSALSQHLRRHVGLYYLGLDG